MSNPAEKNWGLYIYNPKSEKKKEDIAAVFVYSDGETSIYPLPGSTMEPRLNRYKEQIRAGQINHSPWQQFNYFLRKTFTPDGDLFELDNKKRKEIADVLKYWDDI